MNSLLAISRCRRALRSLPQRLGDRYDVLATDSILAAFRWARALRFDLAVVRTAHNDAFARALLKWIVIHNLRLPTIVLIGPGASQDLGPIHRLNATMVLREPVNTERICRAIAAVLGQMDGETRTRCTEFELHAPIIPWLAVAPN